MGKFNFVQRSLSPLKSISTMLKLVFLGFLFRRGVFGLETISVVFLDFSNIKTKKPTIVKVKALAINPINVPIPISIDGIIQFNIKPTPSPEPIKTDRMAMIIIRQTMLNLKKSFISYPLSGHQL